MAEGKRQPKKRALPSNAKLNRSDHVWSCREKKAIYEALKKHGFSDTKLIAEEVGTRSQNEVEYFINTWTKKSIKEMNSEINLSKLFGPCGAYQINNLEEYPPSAVWRKIIQNLLPGKMKHHDHSKIYAELFKKYAEEEPEFDDPDLPNFKNIYKFLSDLLSGTIPAQLSPTDAYVPLFLMEELMQIIQTNDFSEESTFAKGFLGPTKLVPVFEDGSRPGCSSAKPNRFGDSKRLFVRIVEENEGQENEPTAQNNLNGSVTSSQNSKDATVPQNIEGASASSHAESKGSGVILLTDDEETASMSSLPEIIADGNVMPELPRSVYESICKHNKVQQHLNPLMIPVYMLEERQKFIHNYFDKLRKD